LDFSPAHIYQAARRQLAAAGRRQKEPAHV
jgi:hypothetical protein